MTSRGGGAGQVLNYILFFFLQRLVGWYLPIEHFFLLCSDFNLVNCIVLQELTSRIGKQKMANATSVKELPEIL